MSTISAIETDTLIQKKPQASLKFQAHMGAANASTKAKKIVGAVAAAALVLGVLAATAVSTGVAPTRTNLSSSAKNQQIKLYADHTRCLTATGTEVGDKLVISTCGGGGGHGTGSELPSYIELSATNSQYTMTPQSCVGKMDCNPKNGEKVVGTSEWPPAEWTRV